MGCSKVAVSGLALPDSLLHTIETGRWKVPSNSRLIADVFGDEPDGPQFYDLPSMTVQNQSFRTMSTEEIYGAPNKESLGIDASLAVLIGDLGADMPIALDYRVNRENPR